MLSLFLFLLQLLSIVSLDSLAVACKEKEGEDHVDSECECEWIREKCGWPCNRNATADCGSVGKIREKEGLDRIQRVALK